MDKYTTLLIGCILGITSFAQASTELDKMLRCHEALLDKADARTSKLSDSPTPIALVSGKKVYFYTHDSGAVLESGFAGKTLTVQLEEQKKPFFRTISFKDNGDFASLSLQEPSAEQKKQSVTPRGRLDKGTLDVLKRELVRQLDGVHAEYQNKYDPAATIAALNVCKDIPAPEIQKVADRQIAYFEKLVKSKGVKKSYNKNPGTQR